MALPEGRRDTRRERRKGKGGDAQNTARHAPLRKTRQNAKQKTAFRRLADNSLIIKGLQKR